MASECGRRTQLPEQRVTDHAPAVVGEGRGVVREPAPIFFGVVDADGRLHLEAIAAYRGWLKALTGQRVVLTVKKWVRQRSGNQNRYWHGVVVPMFAAACGYAPWEHDAVHDELMRVLWGLKPDSNPMLKIRESSTKLTTAEFNKLIELAQVFGAEKLGIVIPDPDPAYKTR